MAKSGSQGSRGAGPSWRSRAGTVFTTEKTPAAGEQGVVVTNHPIASAAGVQMLAQGGNAIDAAVAALFTLTVVEPMMVGLFGAGWTNIRFGDGRHRIIDNYSCAPAAATPELFEPVSDQWPDYMATVGRANELGHLAVGVPGTLKAWTELITDHGALDLPTVMAPAIHHADRGFRITPYLATSIATHAKDLAASPEPSALFLPSGSPLQPGDLLRQPELADSLRLVATDGAAALYGGSLGRVVADDIQRHGGILTLADLEQYRTIERPPLSRTYRGHEITVPPPPCSGGLHILQILELLSAHDVGAMGYGTADSFHLLAECFGIAFADRAAHVGDPAVAEVPVDWLLSPSYAAERRAGIDLARRSVPAPGAPPIVEPSHTTQVTTADADGTVVSMTQTINAAFGAKVMTPGTGLLLNNTMAMFDPHPGQANSVGPSKRMTSSMAPTIVSKDGRPVLALGTPGGVRIFPSVTQAIINVIDHQMSIQEAIEAPRVWTQGQDLEVEADDSQSFGVDPALRDALSRRGHRVKAVPNIAGGMNAVSFTPEGTVGAACWRADGTPIALGGGLARRGVQFRTTASRRT